MSFVRLMFAAALALGLPAAQAVDFKPPPIKLPSEPVGTKLSGAPKFNAGGAFADALQTGKTGVYVLGTTTLSGRSATTYGLIRDGRVLDVASKSGTAWLAKRPGSTGGLGLSGAKFDQLIAIGGVNGNVEAQGAAKLNSFLQTAGLAGSSGGGGVVTEPIPKCIPTATNPCTRPITRVPSRAAAPLLAVLEALVPSVAARDCGPIGCVMYFSFGEISPFRFRFEYNEQGGYWGFNGFGIVAIWLLAESTGG
jgi:hypothetical protein